MGLHDKAWAGMNVLVFGKTPLSPMKVEQAIATAAPANEVRVDSFEDYSDALDHCKNKRNAGFIFLLEDVGDLPLNDVFTQLSRPYEAKGWPAFGVLVYERAESIKGLRAMQSNPHLLSYLPLSDILDRERVSVVLQDLWSKFIAGFESHILPLSLQETLISLAKDRISEESIHFCDRVSQLLSSNLNVSWIDAIALRWGLVINAVKKSAPAALLPHTMLVQICDELNSNQTSAVLETIVTSKLPLASRVYQTSLLLDQARIDGNLTEQLTRISTMNKPGAPTLVRHIASNRDRILSVAQEESTSDLRRSAS